MLPLGGKICTFLKTTRAMRRLFERKGFVIRAGEDGDWARWFGYWFITTHPEKEKPFSDAFVPVDSFATIC